MSKLIKLLNINHLQNLIIMLSITFINNVLLFQQCSPDSLFDSDDCVLTDVNLSEASEAGLLLSDYKNKFSYSSLNSDGDSYPNSPINGKLSYNTGECALKCQVMCPEK